MPKICFEISDKLKKDFDEWWEKYQKLPIDEKGICDMNEYLAMWLEEMLDTYEL